MKKFNKISITTVVAFTLVVLSLAGPITMFAAGPATINLGTAGNFVVLAKTGISTTGSTSIVGDIGVSPAAATFITGFALTLPSASSFSTSALVIGKVYAPGYADPTPSNMTTAVSNMETAYTDGAGRTNPTATELGAGNIGGMTLAPGLYKWGTSVTIPGDLTLSGSANDVWIFQIAQNLNISSATKIILAGGAQGGNIFWIVGGQATIGTTALFNGNILSQTAIVLNTGATLNGRALAQTAVTLDSNAVIMPTSGAPAVVPITPVVSAIPAIPATPATPTVTSATPATPAVSVAEQTQLDQLFGIIQALQAQIRVKVASNANTNVNAVANANSNASFKRDLTVGTTGDDVKALQVWLNARGFRVASNGSGATGNETTTFGGLTRAALAKFQASVGISPALGNFGPITRNYINSH